MFYSWIPFIYLVYDHPDEIWLQRLFSVLYPSLHLKTKNFTTFPTKKDKKKKPSIEQSKPNKPTNPIE